MYLSVGNDMAVRENSIIGIFDMDNTSTSKRTREFLEKAEKEGLVIPCDDLPKSYVLTAEYGVWPQPCSSDGSQLSNPGKTPCGQWPLTIRA